MKSFFEGLLALAITWILRRMDPKPVEREYSPFRRR